MLQVKDNPYTFEIHTQFKGEFLSPIINNLNEKFIHHYDDYNEVYHCNHLIHEINKLDNVTLNYHVLYKDKNCIGIAMISLGQLDSTFFLGKANLMTTPKQSIVLNYFHISEKGNGLGTKWLNEIILPYYKQLGKETLYLKSSHSKAFPFYERLGEKIGDYITHSDNHQFIRHGQLFKINF